MSRQQAPTGVQLDLSPDLVAGWSLRYEGRYTDALSDSAVTSVFPGGCVMVGARGASETNFRVAAFLDADHYLRHTATNSPTLNRGVWFHHVRGLGIGVSDSSVVVQNHFGFDYAGRANLCFTSHVLSGSRSDCYAAATAKRMSWSLYEGGGTAGDTTGAPGYYYASKPWQAWTETAKWSAVRRYIYAHPLPCDALVEVSCTACLLARCCAVVPPLTPPPSFRPRRFFAHTHTCVRRRQRR